MTKLIKLNKEIQRNMLITVFITTVAAIYLFNLFWEPMLFMLAACYVILNRDKAITSKELILMGGVKTFLFYSCLARMFGMAPALFITIFMVILLIVIYKIIFGGSRNVKKQKK